MEIKVYNNVFENEFESFEYDPAKPLIEQIENHINKETYKEILVECYDSETGETFYAPMIDDNIDTPSVMIFANGQVVSKEYVPEQNDLVKVVFFPASNNQASWTAVGAAIGLIIGGAVALVSIAATGGLSGLAIFGLVAGFGIIGGVTGYYLGGMADAKSMTNRSKTDMGEVGAQQPDVRGSENSSLKGNNFPMVIGKHLVTPFVVGDPVTEYSGVKGADAYIRMLLCVGYAPLKLTDFKLGEFWLAYNRSHKIGSGTTITKDTLLTGLLKGYSYGGVPDNGDILDYWKNNDVSLEIIQQPLQTGEAITIDEVYQEQTTIDLANRPQISQADMRAAGWTEASGTQTVYSQHYTLYQNEKAVTTILVTPILSDGTVLTPGQTADYASQILADESISVDILLATFSGADSVDKSIEYAQGLEENQQEYYNHETYPDGINYGTVYPYTANDQQINANVFFIADKALDNTAQVTYKGTSFPNNFKTNGVWFTDSCPRKFTVNISFPAGLYRTWSHTETVTEDDETVSETQTKYGKIPLWVCAQWRIYNENNASSDPNGTDYSSWNNLDFGYTRTLKHFDPSSLYDILNTDMWDVSSHHGNDLGNWEQLYANFINKNLQNFYDASGQESVSEIRFSATVTLTNEQIAQLMADTNPTKSIEIRVIRISPNYMNDLSDTDSASSEESSSSNDGPESYSDHLKVVSIVTESFDEETYLKTGEVVPVRPLSDEDYRKLCLVAIKAKADASGYLVNQLAQVNCIAESFSPYWDFETHKIMPEGIFVVRKYYGYFDQNNNRVNRSSDPGVTEREVTRQEYEQARQDGFNWYREDKGSNFSSTMRRIVFSSSVTHNGRACYKLTQDAANYNNNSVSSGFMLACVGPQNGPLGLGYENIDILSIGDWAEKTEALRDGTTANRNLVYRGVSYQKGDELPIRMEANGYVYGSTKLEDLLQKIAFAGRAVWCADDNGRIRVLMDGPVDYTSGVINSQNCVSSSNTFSYEDLPAGFMVSFSDENDGYEQNQFYVWADGNSLKSYHGQVEALSIDFVTNNYQMYSLGRYLLAVRLQTREVLTRKIGPEGRAYRLGDVVLVQSEDLLIGDGSGRIQEVLEANGVIYGLICDAPYEYKAEQSSDDNYSTQGVTIFQPRYAGKSNAVTLPISMPDSKVVDGKVYVLEQGTTNVVLFGEPIQKGGNDPSATTTLKYNFKTGDICMFGLRDKISAPYRISKIKPEKDGCYSQTLLPYDEGVYRAGTELPSFQNYITPPEVVEPPISLSETPTTLQEQMKTQMSLQHRVNGLVNGQTVVDRPDVVTVISAVAERDGIRIVWNPLSSAGMKNVIHHYTVEISKDGGSTWIFSEEVKDSQFYYAFKRTGVNADLYPEASALDNWYVRISSVNIYGRPAGTLEDPPNYSTPVRVNTDSYGTWIIPVVSVTKEVVDRTIVWTVVHEPTIRPLYGNLKTLVSIKRIGNTDPISVNDQRTYNDMLCIQEDSAFFAPEFNKIVNRIDSYEDYIKPEYGNTEDNYKKNSQVPYTSLTNKITQTLPLIGQNPRIFQAGDIPVIKPKADPSDPDVPYYQWEIQDVYEIPLSPTVGTIIHYIGGNIIENNEIKYAKNAYYMYNQSSQWEQVFSKSMAVPTTYYYQLQMVNEAYQSNVVTDFAVALPTNISDIVHSHEHYKELYVEKLSAITANVGLIQQGGMGSFQDKLNYWALSDMNAADSGVPGGVKKGAFRVGGQNEYFKVTPLENGEYKIELKAGNIELTSTSDSESTLDFFNGTYVYNELKTVRLQLSPSGILVQKNTDTQHTPPDWSDDRNISVLTKITINQYNDLIIANTNDTPEFGYQLNGVSVYHFDGTDTDEEGLNPHSITAEGSYVDNNDSSRFNVSPLLNTVVGKSLDGSVSKDISQYTGKIAFATKASEIKLGTKAMTLDGTFKNIPSPLTSYNTAMQQTSSVDANKTVGGYLGLSDTQVQQGIFY